MSRRSRTLFPGVARSVAMSVVVVLAMAACGSGSKPGAVGLNDDTPGTTTGTTTGSSSKATSSPLPTTSLPPPAVPVKPSPSGTGPSPFAYPWTPSPDLPVDAEASPACVQRGGLVTLTVHTKPKAGIAYIAIYSDNGTGAPKPYGSGYGGNDKGYSGPTGDFASAFNVSHDAPEGPARVDVIVGWNNAWGYDAAPFEVAGLNGRC